MKWKYRLYVWKVVRNSLRRGILFKKVHPINKSSIIYNMTTICHLCIYVLWCFILSFSCHIWKFKKCFYVCMCMYVFRYVACVCMYVFRYVVWMYVCMYLGKWCVYVCMHVCAYLCIYACFICACMCTFMYVCMFICIFICVYVFL